MIFGSDNMAAASPRVMAALQEANSGTARSYGNDPWTKRAEEQLAEVFEHDLAAFFVTTGTVANCLALSAIAEPWNAVLCHRQAHILLDEGTAPEFFTGGARLIPVAGTDGKITAENLRRTLERLPADPPHNVTPAAVSISQVSESGLVYRPEEIAALAEAAASYRPAGTAAVAGAPLRKIRIHVDGARFASAVASLRCSPADVTWRAGVDVLCLGATKNGALAAEAVIFFDRELAANFAERRKRAGQLLSKGRLLGAQFLGWLKDGHWLDLARSANAAAKQLADGLSKIPGVRIPWPVEANEVFAVLPRPLDAHLRAAGADYHEWYTDGMPANDSLALGEVYVRLVTSFATQGSEVQAFLDAARGA